ncbi:hypothetical protein [Virgibacillus proomii]|uniref:hypothetical protein n=1 Tax=Virgibacillus proomii TaxID=84407 RepID=UPI000985600C|nr:hypothetical protein [Virgibacillus proomii]
MLYRAFKFGLSLSIPGFMMLFFARIVSDFDISQYDYSDIKSFPGIFDISAYYIPISFLIIGLPFVIIIPFIWLSRWAKK